MYNGQHPLGNCNQFKALAVAKRNELVHLLNLCVWCLKGGHWARDCSGQRCGKCGQQHHSTLHYDRKEPVPAKSTNTQSNNTTESASSSSAAGTYIGTSCSSAVTAFMTKEVDVGANGRQVKAMTFLDSGSSCNYVTEELTQHL